MVDKPAWTETVTKPAWTETIEHPESTTVVHVVRCNYCGQEFPTSQEASAHNRAFFTIDDVHSVAGYGDRFKEEVIPAWTETIEHPAETKTVEHPAETHTVNHPAEGYYKCDCGATK